MVLLIKRKQYLKIGILLFLIYTIRGLFNFITIFTEDLARSNQISVYVDLIEEFTGVYSALLLLPILIWFFKKVPLRADSLLKQIPLHLFATFIYGASHTLMMYGSRLFFFWVLRWGVYDYGRMDYRFMMEYSKQFIAYWTIYAIYSYFKTREEREQQDIRAKNLEKELIEARLQSLKTQIQPHFLFNTLNMISSTMYEDLEVADSMIANLSDLLRHSIQLPDQNEHRLRDENEITEAYLSIMRARFKENLQVKWTVSENLETAQVPRFLLQPLVENAIQYSMAVSNYCSIQITAKRIEKTLQLIVADEGPGLSEDMGSVLEKGIGLSNVASRLEHLYGDNAKLQFENQLEGGLKVMIELPLIFLSGPE